MTRSRSTEGVLCFGGGDHAPTLQALLDQARERGWRGAAHPADPDAATHTFSQHAASGWQPGLVVFGAGTWQAGCALDTPAEQWDVQWRDQCLPAARIGQAAITHLMRRGGGTLVFLGHVDGLTDARPAASTLNGPAGALFGAAHAAASAGLRALAQAMARGFGPQGVHVAHLVGDLRGPASPAVAQALAQACWALHAQAPSAWSHELDLRRNPGA
jgi:NAD(P)-dependent dehydrogenase (short-subunit alcohol dehydrogenase family)